MIAAHRPDGTDRAPLTRDYRMVDRRDGSTSGPRRLARREDTASAFLDRTGHGSSAAGRWLHRPGRVGRPLRVGRSSTAARRPLVDRRSSAVGRWLRRPLVDRRSSAARRPALAVLARPPGPADRRLSAARRPLVSARSTARARIAAGRPPGARGIGRGVAEPGSALSAGSGSSRAQSQPSRVSRATPQPRGRTHPEATPLRGGPRRVGEIDGAAAAKPAAQHYCRSGGAGGRR